jgi:DNA-binding NarL/FixJ family response regulator
LNVCSVLIADSNARLARVLAELLADEHDFSVLEVCSTPEQALELARVRRPDVALVSERLAGRPGTETCAALRTAVPEATLLLWSHDPARRGSDADAADAVLERGMTFRDLVAVVRRTRAGAPAVTETPVRTVAPAPAPAENDPDGHLVLTCESCGLRRPIPTQDMPSAVVEAREFFARHDECATAIDLAEGLSTDALRP